MKKLLLLVGVFLLPIYTSGQALKWEKVQPNKKDKTENINQEETQTKDSTKLANEEVLLAQRPVPPAKEGVADWKDFHLQSLARAEFKDSLEFLSLKEKLISFKAQNEFKAQTKDKGFKSLENYYSNLNDSFYENLILTKGYLTDENFELITYVNEPTIEYAVPETEIQLMLNKKREVIIGNELHTYSYYYIKFRNWTEI
ncbi:MAG: hypothetical protein NXI00_08645 [Cytophagales bacterium]|nr:hypothetical protein [Cytophagales bacterium]